LAQVTVPAITSCINRVLVDHFSGPGAAVDQVCVCLCVRTITMN